MQTNMGSIEENAAASLWRRIRSITARTWTSALRTDRTRTPRTKNMSVAAKDSHLLVRVRKPRIRAIAIH